MATIAYVLLGAVLLTNFKEMKDKRFTVESGEERWDYDGDVPTRGIVDYWVRLGSEVIKKFAYRSDAEKYAKKLNDALSAVK